MTDVSARRATLAAATLASFVTPFMGSATSVALPAIGQEFSMDAVQLSWVATAYLLSAAVFLVPFGRIADIHGRKRVYLGGMILFSVASVLAGLSGSGLMLVAARIAQGIGSAMIFGTGMAILTSVFPARERGRVLGITVAAVYIGLSLGPFVGGFLTFNLGWRAIFVLVVPLGLLAIFFMSRLRGEWADSRGEPFDLSGSAIYGLSLIALMLGFSTLPATSGFGLILLGIVGFVAFVVREMRTAFPVLNIGLFTGSRTFAFSNLSALINYSATAAVTFLMSLYLQYVKALTPQQAGLVLVSQPVFQAALSPLAGRLSDRIEPRIIASAGMSVTTVGLILLALLRPATPILYIVLCLILLGFGFALFSAPNMNAIMGSVEKSFYGVASGTLGTMRLLGQMLSMGIATLLFALYLGRVEITPVHYPVFLASAKTAFLMFACLCAAGIFFSLARGSLRDDSTT